MTKPRPFCRCGCKRRVKRPTLTWATPACVPSAVRAAGARKSRRLFAYRRRARTFREELQRLTASGRAVTTEALLTALWHVYRVGYNSGYQTGRKGLHPHVEAA